MNREPSLIIATVGAILSGVAAFGLDFLTAEQAAIVVVVLNAGLGAWNALKVRPVQPAVFTYLLTSLVTLAAAYGYELSQSQVAGINGAVLAILALMLRGNVSPSSGGGVDEMAVRARSGPSPY